MGSGKTRRILVYPRNLFPKKQLKEAQSQQKERDKLKDKLLAANFPPLLLDNPVTMRDRLMKEVWLEIQGKPIPDGLRDIPWEGPTAERIEALRAKMRAFEVKAQGELKQAKVNLEASNATKEAAKEASKEVE
jgi:hypothetical protein